MPNMESHVLLVAAEPVGKLLAGQFGKGYVTVQSDPYQAMIDMSMRPWSGIVLGAWQDDFDELCSASRRLRKDSKIIALCDPADEWHIRKLVGRTLDDYFIFPPNRADLASLKKILSPPQTPAADSPSTGAITPAAMVRLVEAAHNIGAIEELIAAMVTQTIGAPCRWTSGDATGEDNTLLVAGKTSPRVLVSRKNLQQVAPTERAFLGELQQIAPALMDSASRFESLHRLAITDHLTGAYNRRYFYHLTDQILQRAGTTGARACMLLYDIDDFKRYNDEFGYAAGDEILKRTASLMGRIVRSHDIVARIGGDEFAVLFWDPDQPRSATSQPLKTAYDLAERFRQAVPLEGSPLLGPQAVGSLTISGGLASFPQDGKDVRQLLRSADKALKASKRHGKNAIRIAGTADED